jgi:hypothetical protein
MIGNGKMIDIIDRKKMNMIDTILTRMKNKKIEKSIMINLKMTSMISMIVTSNTEMNNMENIIIMINSIKIHLNTRKKKIKKLVIVQNRQVVILMTNMDEKKNDMKLLKMKKRKKGIQALAVMIHLKNLRIKRKKIKQKIQ